MHVASLYDASYLADVLWFLQPLFYAMESIMTNEFHTLDGLCSTLVPSGLGYEGVSLSNQVCTVPGSQPGQNIVSGSLYVRLSFGYSISHLWRVRKGFF